MLQDIRRTALPLSFVQRSWLVWGLGVGGVCVKPVPETVPSSSYTTLICLGKQTSYVMSHLGSLELIWNRGQSLTKRAEWKIMCKTASLPKHLRPTEILLQAWQQLHHLPPKSKSLFSWKNQLQLPLCFCCSIEQTPFGWDSKGWKQEKELIKDTADRRHWEHSL